MWILGIEPGSSAKAIRVLNPWATVSEAPRIAFLITFFQWWNSVWGWMCYPALWSESMSLGKRAVVCMCEGPDTCHLLSASLGNVGSSVRLIPLEEWYLFPQCLMPGKAHSRVSASYPVKQQTRLLTFLIAESLDNLNFWLPCGLPGESPWLPPALLGESPSSSWSPFRGGPHLLPGSSVEPSVMEAGGNLILCHEESAAGSGSWCLLPLLD